MPNNSKLDLPGKFEKGKKYWLDGATLDAWQQNLRNDRAIAGEGLLEKMIPGVGRIFALDGLTGANLLPPFRLTVSAEAAGTFWSVSSDRSTVTDGTNGAAVDLSGAGFDAPNSFSGTKFIVLQADVDASLVLTNWALAAVDLADADEVAFNVAGDEQIKLRLLIGKVVIDSGVASATQACFAAQRIEFGFLNGVLIKVFTAAPVHPSGL